MRPRKAPRTRTTTASATTTTPMTVAAIRALISRGVADALAEQEIQINNNLNGDGSQGSGSGIARHVRPTRKCTYSEFLKCQPLNFKGTEGVVGLTQWFERIKSVFHISNCAIENQVKFSTCTLHGIALTWWNTYVRIVSHDATYGMPWKTLMKMMTDKYYPRNEIKKLEIEIWDLKNVVQAYAAGTGERKEYAGTLPFCNKCKFHHNGPCIAKCANCKKIGHLTRDCWNPTTTSNQRIITCYECGNQGNYKSDCLKLKNQNHGNQAKGTEARGMVYALGGGETDQDPNNIEDEIEA
ncbi:putative reverse transcriptase domain-containing protein [Tanacetum coccineum]